ncbi:Cyclic di-GMP phosphodiesterase response regulator RpfG [Gimesia panareensis]|uniref:Cyclic di-GMP phosphodiesterase response regulator RpfG n=1 Tax=Gimesia panareensis TaxID=2527978 RepID=A0A517Q5D4_9PLAN|nr:HD domain-containing phosphohydrolase [Gimesia panareensis]QDT26839.1 Cyclic di-GMP phosphodiesterase response regulator RpfG [Gimesia panareensis]
MTTEIQDNPELTACDAAEQEETVAIRVEDLIVGRTIQNPIYDAHGVLLLAEGAVITSRFKELLRDRKQDHVEIHNEDASTVSLNALAGNPLIEGASPGIFSTELTEKLDRLIESGSMFVANTGPALRDSMVVHGCKGYDKEHRENLFDQQQAFGESLDNMMRGALKGSRPSGSEIAGIAANYLTQLTSDADCVISVAMEAGSDETLSQHCLQMSLLGMAIGAELNLDEGNIRTIGLCGLVHDWGMVKVQEKIGKWRRRLEPLELMEMRKHPIFSLEMLEEIAGIPSIVPVVCYQVHEQPNGEGYPRQRSQNMIHLFARILNVAHWYVSLTSSREDRPALMPYAAMEYMLRMTNEKTIDSSPMRALLNLLSLFPVGSFVTLTDGSAARVIRRNGDHYTSPIVQIIQTADGKNADLENPDMIIDLKQSDLEIDQALPTPGKDEIDLTSELFDGQV